MIKSSKVKLVGEYFASLLRYTSVVRWLVNASGFGTQLSISESAKIQRNVSLKGDISIADEATIRNGCNIEGEIDVGTNATLFSEVTAKGTIQIGRSTNVGERTSIIGDVTLGKYCGIGPEVLFQAENHLTNRPSQQVGFYKDYFEKSLPHLSKGGIDIGHDVWVGHRATILPGVNVGHGAIIGANSVVTHDVEPYAVVAGVPAERKKWRFEDSKRTELLNISWWDWEDEKIKRNEDFFSSDLRECEDIQALIKD